MTASFATVYPIAKCLWPETEKFLGHELNWEFNEARPLQRMMRILREPAMSGLESFSPGELKAVSADNVNVINRFLRENGFRNMNLTDMGSGSNFMYLAAAMKLLGEYLQYGEKGHYLPKISRKAFRLGKEAGVKHFQYGDKVVVEIPTKGNFSLLVTSPFEKALGWEMVLPWAIAIRSITTSRPLDTGNGVILSMANIDETPMDVSDLVGMTAGDWVVCQAKMAAKFSLTPFQVKFESAFAMGAMRGGGHAKPAVQPGDYVADHDLAFAIMRKGQVLPLVAGLVPVADLANEDLR